HAQPDHPITHAHVRVRQLHHFLPQTRQLTYLAYTTRSKIFAIRHGPDGPAAMWRPTINTTRQPRPTTLAVHAHAWRTPICVPFHQSPRLPRSPCATTAVIRHGPAALDARTQISNFIKHLPRKRRRRRPGSSRTCMLEHF